jgi:hypothetical protein
MILKYLKELVKCVEKGKSVADILALEHGDWHSLPPPLTLMKPESLHLHIA